MKIGIIADTHNNIELTREALNYFTAQNVDLVIHAGDLTSPKMLELFEGFNCKFVLGNADIDIEELNCQSDKYGFGCIDQACSFEADGKRFIVFHGNNVPMFRQTVASGNFDYIIKGHTHFFENYVSNNTRIINPGSLYGTGDCSIAILDTDTDKVELYRIETE